MPDGRDESVMGGFVAGYETAVKQISSAWPGIRGAYRDDASASVRSAASSFRKAPPELSSSLYHLSTGEARHLSELLFNKGVLDVNQFETVCEAFGNLRSSCSGRYRALYDRETNTPYVYFGSPAFSGRLVDARKEEVLFALYCKFHEYWHLLVHILSGRDDGDGRSVVSAASIVAGEAFAMKGPLIISWLLHDETGLDVYRALGMTYYPAEEHSDARLQELWSTDGSHTTGELLSHASTPYLAFIQDVYAVEEIDAGYYAQLRLFDRLLENRGFDIHGLLCDLLDHYEVTTVSFSDYVPARTMGELEEAVEAIGSGRNVDGGMMKLVATYSDGEGRLREKAGEELSRLAPERAENLD